MFSNLNKNIYDLTNKRNFTILNSKTKIKVIDSRRSPMTPVSVTVI